MIGKCIVVGAGINGLCAAFWLHSAGWQVDILDSDQVPNPCAASYGRSRLLHGFDMSPLEWAQIKADWKTLNDTVHFNGFARTGVITPAHQTKYQDRGPDTEVIDADEIATRFPQLSGPERGPFLLDHTAGVIFAQEMMHHLTQWIQKQGVVIHDKMAVQSICPDSGVVQLAKSQQIKADRVILAAGHGAGSIHLGRAAQCQRTAMRTHVVYCAADKTAVGQNLPAFIKFGGLDDLWGVPPVNGIGMKLGSGAWTTACDDLTQPAAITARDVTDRFSEGLPALAREIPTALGFNHWAAGRKDAGTLRRIGRVSIFPPCNGGGFKHAPTLARSLI